MLVVQQKKILGTQSVHYDELELSRQELLLMIVSASRALLAIHRPLPLLDVSTLLCLSDQIVRQCQERMLQHRTVLFFQPNAVRIYKLEHTGHVFYRQSSVSLYLITPATSIEAYSGHCISFMATRLLMSCQSCHCTMDTFYARIHAHAHSTYSTLYTSLGPRRSRDGACIIQIVSNLAW